MIVKIHARDFSLSAALSEYTESKIRLSLGIYKNKIRRVDVFMSDVNGPKGGEDMMCRIRLEADGIAPIVMESTESDMYHAINVCTQRIKRTAARQFNRVSHHRRRMPDTFPSVMESATSVNPLVK